MDILPSGNIFRELQDIHDTGYFSFQPSFEDQWQQVNVFLQFFDKKKKKEFEKLISQFFVLWCVYSENNAVCCLLKKKICGFFVICDF